MSQAILAIQVIPVIRHQAHLVPPLAPLQAHRHLAQAALRKP